MAAAVRVLLERLQDAEAAAELAKRAGSQEASLAVACHCEQAGLPQLAMEQYWLAGDSRTAFLLAKRTDAVPAFAALARQAGDAGAALLAAEFFEAQGSLAVAAELCALAGQAERAARLYIQVGRVRPPLQKEVLVGVALAGCVGQPWLCRNHLVGRSLANIDARPCRPAATRCPLPSSWHQMRGILRLQRWCWSTCR